MACGDDLWYSSPKLPQKAGSNAMTSFSSVSLQRDSSRSYMIFHEISNEILFIIICSRILKTWNPKGILLTQEAEKETSNHW